MIFNNKLRWKLVFRILLLAVAFLLYFTNMEKLNFAAIFNQGFGGIFLWLIWIMLIIDMLYRLFPNKRISIGARKHFACSYNAAPSAEIYKKDILKTSRHLHRGAFFCAFTWLTTSAVILFVLYLLDILTPATVLIFSLVYSVLDLIFVLFFCPFQKFFMHNQCCVSCRIYNWDYFMMCAPMILFPNFYSIMAYRLKAYRTGWDTAIFR